MTFEAKGTYRAKPSNAKAVLALLDQLTLRKIVPKQRRYNKTSKESEEER